MGDRSSIYIISKGFPKPIQIYGHYGSDDNATATAIVLSKTTRLGDAWYLTGQLFYQFAIVQGGYVGDGSFGIGSVDTLSNSDDNPPIYLNADNGEVEYGGMDYTKTEFVEEFGELAGLDWISNT